MKITGQTTFAELAAERARLGIEWMALIHNDADDQRVRISGVLTIGGAIMGAGDNLENAFSQLFEAAERAIAWHSSPAPPADPVCRLDPLKASAWCSTHDIAPDWTSEIPGYKGPSGWICPTSGKLLADRERSMWTIRGTTHEIVDEEDDHRILVGRCRERFNFIPAASREPQGAIVDCARCEALYAEVQRG